MHRLRHAPLTALCGLLALALAGHAADRPARSAAARPASNLILNPGFEEPLPGHPWMPAHWDTSVSGLASVFFGRDTFIAHGGHYSISIANLSTIVPMAHNWSQSFIVPRSWWGKDAVFSIWTRSNGLQGRAFIRAAVYRDTLSKMARLWGMTRDKAGDSLGIKPIDDPILELGWRTTYFVEPETEWVKREARIYLPPSMNWLRLSCGMNGTGQVVLDDASLTVEPAAPPPPLPLHTNLLADPGFEGDGTAWEYSMPPYAGVRVERDTTLAHGGRACMHYQDDGAGFNMVPTGACQPIVNRAIGGKHVRVSAWLKTDSLIGNANVAMFFKTLRGTTTPVPKLYSQTMDWTPISLEADTPPGTYEAWIWFMYQSPSSGRVYFDDCSFEVLGPALEVPRPTAGAKRSAGTASAAARARPKSTPTPPRKP